MAKKILVIDDEPHIVMVLVSRLKANNYEVITADNGEAGIEKAKMEKPDLILLDIMMPDLDGHDVLKRLKQDKETKAIPVMMLTAKKEKEDIVKDIIVGGAIDYIVKPFVPGELLGRIKKVC
ncbi:MAG: response regulator [Candidatus Omnitrophota bacterium]